MPATTTPEAKAAAAIRKTLDSTARQQTALSAWVDRDREELLQRQPDQLPGRLRAVARPLRVARRRRTRRPPEVALAEALVELQELTERLRRDCPWDREQTERTIVPHTVEEAYEVADAALAGDDAKLLDELGDLLFQVVLPRRCSSPSAAPATSRRSRAASPRSCRAPPARLRRRRGRRPPAGCAQNWERLKVEQEEREGVFHDVPETLPGAAAGAQGAAPRRGGRLRLSRPRRRARRPRRGARASSAPSSDGEPAARDASPTPRVAAELGDVLFACVNVARRLNVDPELELRAASRRFRARVEQAERLAAADGQELERAAARRAGRLLRRGQGDADERDRRRPRPQVLDSRGNPTVEVDVALASGALGRAIVPSGASTGVHEAVELRDGGARLGRQGRRRRRSRTSTASSREAVVGLDAADQAALDRALIDARRHAEQGAARRERDPRRLARRREGRGGRRRACRSTATSAATRRVTLPVPMMNVINGGAHAANSIDLQEFMLVPAGAELVRRGAADRRRGLPRAEKVLHERGLATGGRRRGRLRARPAGRARRRSRRSSRRPSAPATASAVAIALDPATSEVYRDGALPLRRARRSTSDELAGFWAELVGALPDRLDRGRRGRGRLGRLEAR